MSATGWECNQGERNISNALKRHTAAAADLSRRSGGRSWNSSGLGSDDDGLRRKDK